MTSMKLPSKNQYVNLLLLQLTDNLRLNLNRCLLLISNLNWFHHKINSKLDLPLDKINLKSHIQVTIINSSHEQILL